MRGAPVQLPVRRSPFPFRSTVTGLGYGICTTMNRATRQSGGVESQERGVHGDRDLLLSCRNVGGEIRRVHQIIEKGWGGQPGWTFVPCGVWSERQTDGVRYLDIAGGV